MKGEGQSYAEVGRNKTWAGTVALLRVNGAHSVVCVPTLLT